MKLRAVMLAVCLLPLTSPNAAPANAADSGCATAPAKLAREPTIELPPDAKITAKEIAFEVDLGSDGRVRGLQIDESSGDAAVDLSVKQTLQAAAYDPPQTGCVTYSGGLRLAFALPAAPSAPPATPAAAQRNPNCVPYVLAFLAPGTRDRKRTGTAVVAVELDAAGTRTAAPTLKQSTGSPLLDAEALRIARAGQYGFVGGSACAPQPFTYNLELTFQ
jgi:TonB family protein